MIPINIVIKKYLHDFSAHWDYAEQVIYDAYGRNQTIMDFVMFYLFVIPSMFLMVLLSFLVSLVRFAIYVFTYINETSINTLIANTFTYEAVGNILCNILRDNATALEITAPDTIADIFPTKVSGIQQISRFTFYRYIVHNPATHQMSFDDMRKLLDLKIQQTLQTQYAGTPIFFNEMYVVNILNISADNYHTQCLSIDVMVIDSLPKYEYLKKQFMPDTSTHEAPIDKDF